MDTEGMDPAVQLYEAEAAGWRAGLYDDIRHTLRAPIVNWIFRVTAANRPAILRYLWGQAKPAFETRGFAEASVAYRDAVLSGVEGEFDLGPYRPADLDVGPADYRELRGQVATFDVVAPRLAVLFELLDRSLSGGTVGERPDGRRAATAPFPEWLDRDRGLAPTLADADAIPPELDGTVAGIGDVHGFDSGLASIHRCLAQWPGFFVPAWADLRPVIESGAFREARGEAEAVAGEFVETLPYRPRLSPDDLGEAVGREAAEAFRAFFEPFREPAFGVIPTLHLYASLAGAAGTREL